MAAEDENRGALKRLPAPTGDLVGDVDADGVTSLAAGGEVAWLQPLLDIPSAVTTVDSTVVAVEVDGPTASARFGAALHVLDFDDDGDLDVAVGAPSYDTGGTDRGQVLLYEFDEGTDEYATSATSGSYDGAVASAQAGFAVGGGDIDGDALEDVFVGSPFYTSGGISARGNANYRITAISGFAYGSGGDSGAAADYNAGWSIAGLDFDQDLYYDVVMGIPGHSNGQSEEGRWVIRYGEW